MRAQALLASPAAALGGRAHRPSASSPSRHLSTPVLSRGMLLERVRWPARGPGPGLLWVPRPDRPLRAKGLEERANGDLRRGRSAKPSGSFSEPAELASSGVCPLARPPALCCTAGHSQWQRGAFSTRNLADTGAVSAHSLESCTALGRAALETAPGTRPSKPGLCYFSKVTRRGAAEPAAAEHGRAPPQPQSWGLLVPPPSCTRCDHQAELPCALGAEAPPLPFLKLSPRPRLTQTPGSGRGE